MKLTFVNVGYGEAMVLECPDSTCRDGVFVMVIDGGGNKPAEFAHSDSGRIPFAEYVRRSGLDHIDVMVSTHIHEDHICGLLPVTETLLPDQLWQILPPDAAKAMRPLDLGLACTPSNDLFLLALNAQLELLERMEKAGRPVLALQKGASGTLCDGLTYRVLAPSAQSVEALEQGIRRLYTLDGEEFYAQLNALDGAMNNRSLMLLLDYKGTRILLPGDTNSLGYGGLTAADVQAHLFKVGHHGQKDGVDDALLAMIRPEKVVCCASSDRRYNSAHGDAMSMVQRSGATLWFSDCPPVDGATAPPHSALTFTVEPRGSVSAQYIE